MKNVCVFLSANNLDDKYVKPAQEFGELLATNNFGFVYGGSDRGLMKVVASSVQSNGGKIIGVSMESLKGSRKRDADEMTIAKDLSERKRLLGSKSDAIVALVGGSGTLDEVTELIEQKKLGFHNKPIIFLNTDNFYLGLKTQFEKMDVEGFLPKRLEELVIFADDPQSVIKYLKSYFSE